jgi:hypothetical protein
MKRFIIISLLTVNLMNVSAQNTGILDDLFRKIEAIMPNQVGKIRANYGRHQTETVVYANAGTNEFCSKRVCGREQDETDSLWNALSAVPEVVTGMLDYEKKERLLYCVHHALDSISTLPSTVESYHFEKHQLGIDTVRYSICLNRGPEHRIMYDSLKDCQVYSRELGPETITFNYETHQKFCGKHFEGWGNIEYSKVEPLPASLVPATAKKYEPVCFDWDLYLQSIMPILSQKGISQRKFKWSQDEDSARKVKDPNIDSSISYGNKFDALAVGETNGTLFFISSDQKAFAEQVLKNIDAATLKYVLLHPEQTYAYRYNTFFNSPNYWPRYDQEMIRSTTLNKDGIQNFVYIGADEKGYYFLLLNTKGHLFFPKEFSSLKSFVNGEKTYYKGMEPKKEKK